MAALRGVPVRTIAAVGSTPAETLLEASSGCDVVVMGRHHRRHVIGAPLGRTTRHVIRYSPVPVVVVDPLAVRTAAT